VTKNILAFKLWYLGYYIVGRVRNRFSFVVAFILCWGFLNPPKSYAAPRKYASIVIDARDGAILHSEYPTEKRYPASLTKMMTLYLLFEALESKKVKLGTRLKVSKKAARQPPCKLGLKAGSKLSVKDALLGLMTKSANDAAIAIAEHLAGSEQKFARLMTKKARVLGMENTVFKNPHGLPNRSQYTSAEDMAILGRSLLQRFPVYYKYFSTQAFWYKGRKYKNHNRLLGKVKGVDGIKTGFINDSGFNLVTSAVRDGVRLVAVVMGGRSSQTRDRRMAQLLEVTFKEVLEDQHLFLASVTPPHKPFRHDRPVLVMAEGATITPPPLPDRKLPEILAPAGASLSMHARAPASNSLVLAEVSRQGASLQTLTRSGEREPRDSLDLIGDKIRSLDPIGDKIRRLESRARLPRHDPDWSVQVGAFSLAKDAHDVAVGQLARLSPSYEATVSVTLSKQKRRNLYRARLSGLTEAEALEICAELKAQGQRCLPIKPHRDPVIMSVQNGY
tara:strand:- start:348 stop:1859 length:1512 start_codon:yes stop_codon:yes gene_type:complete